MGRWGPGEKTSFGKMVDSLSRQEKRGSRGEKPCHA